MGTSRLIGLLTIAAQLGSAAATSTAFADAHSQAMRIYDRLAGVPIAVSDPRLAQMEALIGQGKAADAAAIATANDSFYNIVVRRFASASSNRALDATVPLNDFIATIVGIAKDDLSYQNALTGNFIYRADPAKVTGTVPGASNNTVDIQSDQAIYRTNAHYLFLDNNRVNLRQNLIQAPQKVYFAATAQASGGAELAASTAVDTAGLLTSRSWSEAHFMAGTNRRATEFALQEFLCSPIKSLADDTMPRDRIRRDVTRTPGGDPGTFLTTCAACHGGLDAMDGAFAKFDNITVAGEDAGPANFIFYQQTGVQAKMNKNGTNFPDGFITADDSWVNNFIYNQNASLGWSGSNTGKGVNALGNLLANSHAFAACTARRVFREVCKREVDPTESSTLDALTKDFQANGYKLKRLFEQTAALVACTGQ